MEESKCCDTVKDAVLITVQVETDVHRIFKDVNKLPSVTYLESTKECVTKADR